mgnify:CR=1 FL=1|jgi:hypothetical protein
MIGIKGIAIKGIAIIVALGIVSGGFAYIQHKDNLIFKLNTQNNVLKKDKEDAILANKILEAQIADRDNEIKETYAQLTELRKEDVKIQVKLRESEKKNASRDLTKLKESKHNELVLKIINRSTMKMFKVFENEN